MEENFIRKEATQRAEAHTDPRLDWWRNGKLGMFIHWGLYACPLEPGTAKKSPASARGL